jgi:tRNA modification GTPase
MVDLTDTICALSSAPGRAGIAVIRLSGPRCREIVPRVFTPRYRQDEIPERRAVLGRIVDGTAANEVDEAVVTSYQAPRSYTGEDVAEISVHGSPVVVAQVLELLCRAGARLAEPGEFTLRAFLHGRMDLAQAEAVRDIIEANTRYQLQVAARQRSGELSHQLEGIKKRLTDIIVSLETAVEFVEDDLALEGRAEIGARLEAVAVEMERWAGTFRSGRIVRNGFTLAIVGRPNAGKSRLFNALLAEERSIVTDVPGTTRDLVSELVDIEGVPVRLIDTAGLREGRDEVEALGVERSRRAIADADAVILVVDSSRRRCAEDEEVRAGLRGVTCLIAWNKADLPSAWTAEEIGSQHPSEAWVTVSALTGAGIDTLRKTIRERLLGGGVHGQDGMLVTNLRHSRCLEAAALLVRAGARTMSDGLSEEFVLADLHRGLDRLGEITGATSGEKILGEIFSRFCIGK